MRRLTGEDYALAVVMSLLLVLAWALLDFVRSTLESVPGSADKCAAYCSPCPATWDPAGSRRCECKRCDLPLPFRPAEKPAEPAKACP